MTEPLKPPGAGDAFTDSELAEFRRRYETFGGNYGTVASVSRLLATIDALRPPAGVDDDLADELFVLIEPYSRSFSTFKYDDACNLKDAVMKLLRSHHTAVTAVGVDTVGHIDVRVDEVK